MHWLGSSNLSLQVFSPLLKHIYRSSLCHLTFSNIFENWKMDIHTVTACCYTVQNPHEKLPQLKTVEEGIFVCVHVLFGFVFLFCDVFCLNNKKAQRTEASSYSILNPQNLATQPSTVKAQRGQSWTLHWETRTSNIISHRKKSAQSCA